MSRRERKVWYGIAGVLLLATLVIAFAPIRVTPTHRHAGKVFARAEWRLQQTGQGTLNAHLNDRALGVSREYLVQSIERGDVAAFALHPAVRLGAEMAQGDTVGVLTSSLYQQRVADLSGHVSVATSQAETFSEGAKQTLIQEAESRLEGLRSLLALQERIVERLRQLRDQAVVSTDEVERAETDAVATRVEVVTVQAKVEVLKSAARPSELRLAASRVEADRRRLEALNQQQEAFAIRLPIPGRVTVPDGDYTLVRVLDTSAWVAVVPFAVHSEQAPAVGTTVALDEQGLTGRVIHVDDSVRRVGAVSVVLVTSLIDAPGPMLDGEPIVISIEDAPILLRTRILQTLGGLFRWEKWWGNATRN